jgi:DNA-directed RNA polymerase subunit omega
MIEALKSDEIINKVGGRFRLTSLIQKRWLELLVDPVGKTEIEVVIEEILQNKLAIDYKACNLAAPESLKS